MGEAVQIESLLAGMFDETGEPLAGGKVYTYAAGTTTPKDTYETQDKGTVADNPIILDSSGRAQIFADGAYKFVIDTADDETLYIWDDLQYSVPTSRNVYGGASGGSANAFTVTNSTPLTSLTDGLSIDWIPNHTPTGAATLNVDGLGAKAIRDTDGVATLAGFIFSGTIVRTVYNASGDYWRLASYPSLINQPKYFWCGTSGGSSNAYTATPTEQVPSALAAGMMFAMVINHSNTGAATLNIAGIGAVNIRKYQGTVALEAGDLIQSNLAIFVYNGSTFSLVSRNPEFFSTFTPGTGAGGTMTYTSITTNMAKYRREGGLIFLCLDVDGTTGGSADPSIIFNLPVAAPATGHALSAVAVDGAGQFLGASAVATGSVCTVKKYDASNWGLGAGRKIYVSGVYPAA